MNEQVLYGRPQFPAQLNMSHPLVKNLVGCWLLNDPSGMRVWDSSPYKAHGITSGFPTSVKKRSFNGQYLNGTSDYVDCGNVTNAPTGDNARTYEIWVKDEAGAGANHFYMATAPPNTNQSFLIGVNGTTKPLVSTAGGANDLLGGVHDLTTSPHHIVGMYKGGFLYLYMDGLLEGTKNITSTNTLNTATLLGKHLSGEYAKGRLYLARIWNRVLCPSEIKNLYSNPYDMFIK